MARIVRRRWISAVPAALVGLLLLALGAQLGWGGSASASPGGTITVDHATTTVPTKLIVSGWCAEPRTPTTPLSLDGRQLMVEKVDAPLGTWGPERVLLGADVRPGRTCCPPGAEARPP